MNDEQRLYPHRIYQINQRLEEVKQVCGIEERLVTFSILNSYNRKFNWLVVNKKRWAWGEKILENINGCFSEHEGLWQELLKKLGEKANKILADSIEYFKRKIENKNLSEKDCEDVHYHLLNLYQYYPHDSDIGIDGVIYRNFVNKRKKLLYAKGELLTEGMNNFHIYPWIDMVFIFESGTRLRSISAQEPQGKNDTGNDLEYYTEAQYKDKIATIRGRKPAKASQDKIYFEYIFPLIMGYPDPNGSAEPFNGKWEKDGKTKYLIEEEKIRELVSEFKYTVCFPVYDAFINKRLYGNFYGNVVIPFAFKEDRDEFIKEYQRKIEDSLFLLIK